MLCRVFVYVKQNIHSFKPAVFKGYLRYKTLLCHKAALDVSLMNFFYLNKKCFVLEISRFLCFVKPEDFKICDVIISIAA